MPEPTSKTEFEKRFHANMRMSGEGADTTVHMPCPFCGAPDWVVYRLLEMPGRAERSSECGECGRSAAILTSYPSDGSMRGAFVQTGGPDAPAWSRLPRLSIDVGATVDVTPTPSPGSRP